MTVQFAAIIFQAPASAREALRGRRDLGNEVAYEFFIGKRSQPHDSCFEPRGAGVNRPAVEFDHAFLAGIGVDARIAHRQGRIAMTAYPAQPVEHRLAGLERYRETLPA